MLSLTGLVLLSSAIWIVALVLQADTAEKQYEAGKKRREQIQDRTCLAS